MSESFDKNAYLLELRGSLKRLGKRIESGDDRELLVWVIPSELACAHRPLRHNRLYGGSIRNLDPAATPLVLEWSAQIRELGIRSIICLMSDEEVELYSRLSLRTRNLLDFYRHEGFAVASIPWKDPAHVRRDPFSLKKKTREISKLALKQFDLLPKPALLHCSAGIDRSAPVAVFIRANRF